MRYIIDSNMEISKKTNGEQRLEMGKKTNAKNMSINTEVTPQRFFLYKDNTGRVQINAIFQNETLWLTQKAMAELFEAERSVITKHIGNIYKEEELHEATVSANFAHTATDGKTYNTAFYNYERLGKRT